MGRHENDRAYEGGRDKVGLLGTEHFISCWVGYRIRNSGLAFPVASGATIGAP